MDLGAQDTQKRRAAHADARAFILGHPMHQPRHDVATSGGSTTLSLVSGPPPHLLHHWQTNRHSHTIGIPTPLADEWRCGNGAPAGRKLTRRPQLLNLPGSLLKASLSQTCNWLAHAPASLASVRCSEDFSLCA